MRRFNPETLKKYTLITGHYGSGKTNFAMQLAFDLRQAGKRVTIVDLDIVNPYFRSSDYTRSLEKAGVTVIGPRFARTALDTPSLSPEVYGVFEPSHPADYVIFDVGGDDAGATALGRFHAYFERVDYQMLAVINYFRNLTQTPAETLEVLSEIEAASRLSISGLIDNSHLHHGTTLADIEKGVAYARAVSEEGNLPLLCVTIPVNLVSDASHEESALLANSVLYPVKIHVQTPWESDSSTIGG